MSARMQRREPKRSPWLIRLAYWVCRRQFGHVPVPLGVMAHSGWVLTAVAGYEMAFSRARHLSGRLKELAMIKTAMMVGCRFCIDLGAAVASKNGVTEDELRGLVDPESCAHFSALDKGVLQYAVAMCSCPMVVPESLFVAVKEGVGSEEAMVELTAAIAWENHRARFNHAVGAREEGFTEKSVCLLPPIATSGVEAKTA